MDIFRRFWTLGFGVIFILIGLAVISSISSMTFYQKMVYGALVEIGFAFVIAWVVGLTVEQGARREYDRYTQLKSKELSRDVFGYLYSVRFLSLIHI